MGAERAWSATCAPCRRSRAALRKGDWKVTVAVHRARSSRQIWPGFNDRAYGLAFDVGSTTIAAHLCDLSSGEVMASSGIMNPQIRFGEDLMSRVSYVMMNPGGDKDMTEVVREAINTLVDEVAAEAEHRQVRDPQRDLRRQPDHAPPVARHRPDRARRRALRAGRQLGHDPLGHRAGLGHQPQRPGLRPALHRRARRRRYRRRDPVREPHLSDEITLVVDVGTNAEIVLGSKKRLLAASSPTGPAFEGAQISCGQRAAPGAIERLRIDPETLEPRFRVIGCDLWSDEEGFAEATEKSASPGSAARASSRPWPRCTSRVSSRATARSTAPRRRRVAQIVQADGRTFTYLIHEGEPEIRITQNDVRAIQLAKAALYAGARLLMDNLGVDRVERIVLAGAFGSHIDVKYAMVLGMIPDCDLIEGLCRRQRRRHRRAHRPAQPEGPGRDRAGGAPGREDRDRRRTEVPGSLRRGHGHSPCDRRLSEPEPGGEAARAPAEALRIRTRNLVDAAGAGVARTATAVPEEAS